MSNNEMRLVAADGELLPAGQADADARKIFDLLRNASGMSASFHALNGIVLVLDEPAIRSRWHSQAEQQLADLQRAGLKWITDVWPDATSVPQAFINVSNRADAFASQVHRALDASNAAGAAHLLDELAGDLGKAAGTITTYRTGRLEPAFGGVMLPIAALTLGPASILAVMADDAVKIAELTQQIDAARQRIEDRARAIAAKMALHAAKLAAALIVIGETKDDKLVKEWGKAFIVMIAAGTTPDLEKDAFLRDFDEILEKMNQINRVGRDLAALVSLGSVIKSVGDTAGGVGLQPIEALLTAGRDRVRAAAARLRADGGAATIAATRQAFDAEVEYARRVAELCLHFQQEAVEAQKPPTFVLLH
jgi:hypothetical protein